VTNKKTITLLLGAGFSQGAGLPGTAQLTNEIVAHAEPHDLCSAIWDVLRNFDPSSNFETMLHAIETLYSIKTTGPNTTTRATASAFTALLPRWDGIASDELLELYENCLRVLHSTLARSVQAVDRRPGSHYERSAEMLRRFIESFEMRVFDLNYDDVAERMAGDIRDGFTRDDMACRFNYDDLCRDDERVEWCHVHGSVRYEMRQPLHSDPHIVKHPSFEAATPGFGNSFLAVGQDKEVAPQGPIISSLRKGGKGRFEPFAIYHHRFVTAMLDCPRLLVIGYGGSDQHISDWLYQWRRVHRDRAQLVWVTHRRDQREPRDDLNFPSYAAGNGEYPDFRRVTDDDLAAGESRTENAYLVFTGSPLAPEGTERAIDYFAS
jgi:hypothetical protein